MLTVQDISNFLETFAPVALAEEWDNVGLLVGDPDQEVTRVMTCLTITPTTAREALERQAEMIITHHPLPFRPLKRLTTAQTASRLLLQLIEGKIAVHSPHTAFDSAAAGINQQLAEALELEAIKPLIPLENDEAGLGAGRRGKLSQPVSLETLAQRLQLFLNLPGLQVVGTPDQVITRVAVACGSAGQFLNVARKYQCDLLITGETNFHTCLEALASGISLFLLGHYGSERFAVEMLAQKMAIEFPGLLIHASVDDRDPIQYVS